MSKRWGVLAVLLMAAGAAFGQGRSAVIKQAESSMLVTGAVEIDATGKLARMTIDKRDELPPAVVTLVEQASSGWTFQPTIRDGHAMRAKGPMTLRLVAKKIDDDHFSLQIRSATFGSDEGRPDEVVTSTRMSPPRYPEDAGRAGVSGTVYLLVRIGRNGAVEDVAAEQTNLRVAGNENQMSAFRKTLERASIAAARRWTFKPPSAGEDAASDHWVARVPVDYLLPSMGVRGKSAGWETYIPGPRARIPWADDEQALAGGADAVSDGGLYQLGSGPKLLTPLAPPPG